MTSATMTPEERTALRGEFEAWLHGRIDKEGGNVIDYIMVVSISLLDHIATASVLEGKPIGKVLEATFDGMRKSSLIVEKLAQEALKASSN